MPWTTSDDQTLPSIEGQSFTRQDVILDGKSHVRCTFKECRLIYRGGPARVTGCYVGPNCTWQFEDAASYVLQFLQEVGWQIIPPVHVAQQRTQ